jgi:hypothetical protein
MPEISRFFGIIIRIGEPAMTIPRVQSVRHVRDYVLELAFDDGFCAEVDFAAEVVGQGGIFQPLEDVAFFARVRLDKEIGTIVWPNEVDFCPEVLRELASVQCARMS